MSHVQLLFEQYWLDKTRGLVLGAARGELLSLLASTHPTAARAAVPHADTVSTVAQVLARRPEPLRGVAHDDVSFASELLAALAEDFVPAATATATATAMVVGVGALATTIVEPTRIGAVATRCAAHAGMDEPDVEAVAWHAAVSALALAGEPYRPVATPRAGEVLDRVARELHAEHRSTLRSLPTTSPDDAAALARDALGAGTSPRELALTATAALLCHSEDLVRAVGFAVAIGGSVAAVRARAAMAGTLLGARLGLRALPEAGTASLLDPAPRVAVADAATRSADLPLLARPGGEPLGPASSGQPYRR